jgi:DNA-binding NarL/FixJ family response regulator
MEIMGSNVSALIVARPGHRRDNLRALLRAVPQLKNINQADDGPSALKIIIDGKQPSLVLLDSTLPDSEVQLILEQTQTRPSRPRSLVLVDMTRSQPSATVNRADEVLSADFSITTFLAVAQRLLTRLDH